MKTLCFSRQTIVRAIRAACIALFLAACARESDAQTITPPFMQTGPNTYGTSSGPYTTGTFYGPTAPYTVTVGSGTQIKAIATTSGSGSAFYNPATNTGVGGGTFTNNGTVSVTLATSSGVYVSDLALFGSGTTATVVNTGELSGTITLGSSNVAGISFDTTDMGANDSPADTNTSLSVTNNGTSLEAESLISGTSNSGYGYGINVNSTGTGSVYVNNEGFGKIAGNSTISGGTGIGGTSAGNVTILNTGSIAGMSTSGSAYGINLVTETTAITAITNGGSISGVSTSGYAEGISLFNQSSATATVTNSAAGSVSATGSSAVGINVDSPGKGGNGGIVVGNAGTVLVNSTTGQALGIQTSGNTATIQVTNTNSLTSTSISSYSTGISAITGGTISVYNTTATNPMTQAVISTGGITVNGNSNALGIYAQGQNAAITIGNDGTIMATSTATLPFIPYEAYGIEATTVEEGVFGTAPISIQNTKTITAVSHTGSAYGISADTAGTITITSGSAATITSTGSGNTSGIYSSAESDTATTLITNNGTIMSKSTGSGYYNAYGIQATTGAVQLLTAIVPQFAQINFAVQAYATPITIHNTGPITAQVTGGSGSAYGISAKTAGNIIITDGGLNASITSTGGGASGSGYGIYAFSSGGMVSVTNSANISVSAPGNGTGITATGTTSSYIGNSADVTVGGTAGQTPQFATGLSIQAGGTATVMNSGGVTASGTYRASGIVSGGSGTAMIGNSGIISAQATTYSAYGINASNSGGVTITNSDMITAQAASVDQYEKAAGIFVSSNGNVTVNNNAGGMIKGINTGSGYAYGVGIGSEEDDSTVNNSDLISSSSMSGTSSAVYINIGDAIMVTNNGPGTIMATSTTGAANGISATSNSLTANNTIVNNGTVSATSTSGYTTGISATLNGDGATGTLSVTNGNMITANTGNGAQTTGGALGIKTRTQSATTQVMNSGTITASAYYAQGVNSNSRSGSITIGNTGMITASGAYAAAVYVNTITGTISITNNDIIRGTGTASTYATFGIQALSNSAPISITNSGTISGSNDGPANSDGILASTTGIVTLMNEGGTISGNTNGIFITQTTAADVITNTGTISSSAGIALSDLGTGNITVTNTQGSFIGGNGHALTLGSGNNTVHIIGNSTITGLMDGGVGAVTVGKMDNTLTFADIIATAPQKTEFNTVSAEAAANPGGDYTVMLGPDDYNFTDFNFVAANFLSAFGTAGLTPNQIAVLGPINGQFGAGNNSPGFAALIAALTPLSNNPAAFGAALDQLSPEEFHRFASETAFNNASFEVEAMDNYLAGLRDQNGNFLAGNGDIDSSGLTVNDPSYDPNLAVIHSRMLAWNPTPEGGLLSDTADSALGGTDMKDSKDMKSVASSGYTDPWNFFIRGNVILAQGFSQIDVGHFDDNTESVVLGTDYRITPHFLVGLKAGYAHTDVTLDDNGSSATVDSYSPGLYASYADKGWYADLTGDYDHNAYTQARNIPVLGQTANSAPEGNEGTANLDGGYDFHRGALTFGPLAGVQYTHLSIDGYSETGSVADLSVNDNESDSLRSRLGGRVSYALNYGGVVFRPHLDATWQHEFMDQARGITAQFNGFGGGAFSVRTDAPQRDFALIDAGFDADINKSATVFVDYVVQAGQSNYFGQSVQAGVKIGF